MKNSVKKVPKLRFWGFSGEWKEKKLGDFLIPEIREIPKPESNYLSLGIRSHFKGTFQKPNFDPAKIAMEKLFVVRPNDLIVNITFAWEGAVAIAKKVDDGGLVSHRFPTYLFNSNVVEGDFFRFIYPSKRFKYYLELASPGGAGRNRVLNKKDFLNIQTPVPNVKEQNKIAKFLTVVDEKIEKLQKKKELIEKYKKGAMQAIFSQKIRFKDEDGKEYPDWQEKKLVEVGQVVGGGTPDTLNQKYWGGNIYWLTPTELKNRYVDSSRRTITDLGFNNSSAKLLPVGSIIFTSRATVGEVAIARVPVVTNQGFQSIVASEESSNLYIYYWAKMNKKEFLRKSSGSTFPEISSKEMKKIKLPLPSLSEQQKIADLLTSTDDKADLIEKKLEQAKNFKKALLQQMFV